MQRRARNELLIRVMSTHDNPHLCGLTEIEVFDKNCKKIAILPSWITLKNLGGAGNKYHTEKLVNGNKFTADDK